MSTIVVTGAAGFIGSHMVRMVLDEGIAERVISVDCFTYAGHRWALEGLGPRHQLCCADIADKGAMEVLLAMERVDAIINCAAESHVDRSFLHRETFLRSNVLGVLTLLDAARHNGVRRVVQVSTDEVYGSLPEWAPAVEEDAPISPNTPYSVTKACGEMVAKMFAQDLEVVITRGANNYGIRQNEEKYIPRAIGLVARGQPITLHGQGQHRRDWIHVEDHCGGILAALRRGQPGATYNLGGLCERSVAQVAKLVCDAFGKELNVTYVPDRPMNDKRYAMDASKAHRELGWQPKRQIEEALPEIVEWYRSRQEEP